VRDHVVICVIAVPGPTPSFFLDRVLVNGSAFLGVDDLTGPDNETRRSFLRKTGMLGMGVALGGVLSACGRDEESPGGGGSGERQEDLKKVIAVVDTTPYGKHAPWFVALERGYWPDRGLDVQIQPGEGSADAVSKTASKVADIGFADTGTLIVARGNSGVKVKTTAMYHYKNLQCCLYNQQNPISEPNELPGKELAGAPGDASFVLLEALAKINGFDASEVKKIPTDTVNHVTSVVTGAADGALTYNTFFPGLEEALGDDAGSWLYADWGIDIYNNGIIVHEDTLESDPDMVTSFNEGWVEAVKWTVENPDEASEIFVSSQPAGEAISPDIARAQLQIALDHLLVPEVTEQGIGPMHDDDKMQRTLDLISEYFDLKEPVQLDDVYTNEFVPDGIVPQA
jgi:NitT/TauT family transport system substrate-binding protein